MLVHHLVARGVQHTYGKMRTVQHGNAIATSTSTSTTTFQSGDGPVHHIGAAPIAILAVTTLIFFLLAVAVRS